MSGADVCVGDDPIYFGAENTTPIPKKHIYPYSKTKYEAEVIVKEANGRTLNDGMQKLDNYWHFDWNSNKEMWESYRN